jgi:hypothetical protein
MSLQFRTWVLHRGHFVLFIGLEIQSWGMKRSFWKDAGRMKATVPRKAVQHFASLDEAFASGLKFLLDNVLFLSPGRVCMKLANAPLHP